MPRPRLVETGEISSSAGTGLQILPGSHRPDVAVSA
jgi:hypothetical protein